MNIQFMTAEKNGIPTGKYDWKGEEQYRYIPDFDALIESASCPEEIEAINGVKQCVADGRFDGFTFEIVYMEYSRSFDSSTMTSSWKWRMMQYPWRRSFDGVYKSKSEMVEEIENICKYQK